MPNSPNSSPHSGLPTRNEFSRLQAENQILRETLTGMRAELSQLRELQRREGTRCFAQ